ncbi:MAG: DNA-binding protein [Synergistaceae bacterium]|jgi:predicted DNA-binding protein YlxM (UPF0122 family)|nr:DNA-binding protein [Synergistaceae bacterium]
MKDGDASFDMVLSERVRFGELLDAYSDILTKKQRGACLALLVEDFTTTEIGSLMGMTRQGAYDLIKRSRNRLEDIERRLGLVKLRKSHDALLAAIREEESALPRRFMEKVTALRKEDDKDV